MKDLLTGFRNKKGSFVIFAVMVFTSLLIMVAAALNSAGNTAVSGAVDSFGRVWGMSILGEYDVYLKERYGLLGFYGNEFSTEEKLNCYAEYSFKDKSYMRYGGAQCQLADYSLAVPQNLKSQIEKIVVEGLKPSKGKKGDIQYEGLPMRRITSQWIIKSLPSYGKTEEVYILGLINKIKAGAGIGDLMGRLAVDKYIFDFFKDYMDNGDLSDTYYTCEIEYIISGKLSDENAKKSVSRKIKNLRNMLNLYYLYTCPEKRQGAMTLAATLTPGPAATLTQAVILETWAYAEAENDMKILYDQKTVPLLKDDSDWALTLENVFSQDEQDEADYVLPQRVRGEDYHRYLGVLLCGMPEDTKLLRIMDLIQINMKYLYCDYFLLKDYNSGLNFQMTVNGETHEFEEHY